MKVSDFIIKLIKTFDSDMTKDLQSLRFEEESSEIRGIPKKVLSLQDEFYPDKGELK